MDRRSFHDGPYNHGSGQYNNGFPGNRPAENVNYGSTFQFFFGNPGNYNVMFDNNNRLQQAPTYDQFSGAGRSYQGMQNQGGPFMTPQPQPGLTSYPPPYHGNPTYGAPMSNACGQPSYANQYCNQGTAFPLGNRPSMQSNQPINPQPMNGFYNSNPSGQGNGLGGGSGLAPQYQSGNPVNNRCTESRCSSTDMEETDDDLSTAGSQEPNGRRRNTQ